MDAIIFLGQYLIRAKVLVLGIVITENFVKTTTLPELSFAMTL